jgi:predicted phosphoribosyltransferase
MTFANRAEAGRKLARALEPYRSDPDVVVLALPRGGVPIGFEVAIGLGAPLDLFVVRKLGVPGREELAMGAVASGGVRVLNVDVIRALAIPGAVVEAVSEREREELRRREAAYRGDAPPVDLRGRAVILVDDGLATGSSMRAAVRAVAPHAPVRTVIAAPVAAPETLDELRREVDDVVCLLAPERFSAVSLWYDDFPQTSDDEVRELFERARRLRPSEPG